MNFETIRGIGRIQRQSLFGQTQSIIEFAFDFSRRISPSRASILRDAFVDLDMSFVLLF